jgi:DNA mismatch repair ATPase MutS
LLQDQIQGVKNTYNTLQRLHTRTVAVSKYLNTIEQIEELLKNHPDENVQLFYRDCLIHKKEASKKLKSVLTLLKTDTFAEDNCKLYWRGKVLLAHKLLQEVHTELTDRIRNMALIDAHVAVATFMKASVQKQMPTCFVEFVDDSQPIELTLTNGWSPLIICPKQVCNSLSLGNEGARTIILTGPNGCGKSTILRVLGIAAWFTQTFGIAPAEYARVSLFNSIRTSLRINDNAATGLSTYMAADAAAERIQTHIDQSHEQHRSLILYGEPYRGTPDQETTRKIMEFCHHIVPNPYFLMALETHVYEPTTLEKGMPQIFTNGHMEINEDVDGNFIRTFTLKNGPANWWFLDHAKRRRFVDWITVVRKQEEIAQKAYEAALMQAYEAAVMKAKKEQEERAQKENATSYLQKTVNGIKSIFI